MESPCVTAICPLCQSRREAPKGQLKDQEDYAKLTTEEGPATKCLNCRKRRKTVPALAPTKRLPSGGQSCPKSSIGNRRGETLSPEDQHCVKAAARSNLTQAQRVIGAPRDPSYPKPSPPVRPTKERE